MKNFWKESSEKLWKRSESLFGRNHGRSPAEPPAKNSCGNPGNSTETILKKKTSKKNLDKPSGKKPSDNLQRRTPREIAGRILREATKESKEGIAVEIQGGIPEGNQGRV